MTQPQKYTLTQWAKIFTMIACTWAIVKEVGGGIAKLTFKTNEQYLDLKKDINSSALVNEQQTTAIKIHEDRLGRLEGRVDGNAQKIMDNEYELTKIKYHVK